jgi:predicted phosphoribosyltransferase
MFFRDRQLRSSPKAFNDRRHAGRILAMQLSRYGGCRAIVLALPRGGVPVGYEVARALDVPLDVFLVRKLGVPGREELAMGAVASGGVTIVSREIIGDLGVSAAELEATTQREIVELERREHLYRGDRPPPDLAGRIVILVDDGLATGASMLAAVAAVRRQGPSTLVVAVPIAPLETRSELAQVADECVVAMTPDPFFSVGAWYRDFEQTSDDEVCRLLAAANGAAST